MTDAEMIKKQAEKIFDLEDMIKQDLLTKTELRMQYDELLTAKTESDARAYDFAQKLKAIEEEIGQYQFDSVTNLVNKIKSILMSENSN